MRSRVAFLLLALISGACGTKTTHVEQPLQGDAERVAAGRAAAKWLVDTERIPTGSVCSVVAELPSGYTVNDVLSTRCRYMPTVMSREDLGTLRTVSIGPIEPLSPNRIAVKVGVAPTLGEGGYSAILAVGMEKGVWQVLESESAFPKR
jgi:hypothetical protein